MLSTAGSGSQASVAAHVILNFFISGSLNQFWGMINTQQLMVAFSVAQVPMPSNAVTFFAKLLQIASFDFVNTEKAFNKILHLNSTGPLTDQLGNLGYSSTLFINNLGTFGVMFIIYIVSLIAF